MHAINAQIVLHVPYWRSFFLPSYRKDLPEGQLWRYFVYSRADFGVFRPAGATRCTDQGQIWQGGVRSFLPNLTLIGSGVGVYGPQNWKKFEFDQYNCP